jgi:hypothetical protein
MDKELRKRIKVAEAAGWTVITDRKHLIFRPADTSQPQIVSAKTGSDWRGLRNLDATLRRAGLVLPWKER